MDTYSVPLGHSVVNISCGQMVGPGESTDRVDPKDPQDKALIKDGALIKQKQDNADEINATTEAVELAEELGVDLDEVDGTGSDGRILVEDVREAADDEKEEEVKNASGQ